MIKAKYEIIIHYLDGSLAFYLLTELPNLANDKWNYWYYEDFAMKGEFAIYDIYGKRTVKDTIDHPYVAHFY